MKAKERSARLLALRVLDRVLLEGAYPDLALGGVLRKSPNFSTQEIAFLTELVYGVIRWLAKLDYVIGLFTSKVKKDEILNILRLGVYQLLFLDGVPDYAAVSETVNLTKGVYGERMGKFVNAVLREVARRKENINYPKREDGLTGYMAINYSFPKWLVERWVGAFGPDYTEKLCQGLNRVPPLTVRVNTLKTTREDLVQRFKERNIDLIPTRYSPDGISFPTKFDPARIPEFEMGLFTVQDEAAQLISYLLDPQPEERVLDVCSAPGGKSTHVAEIMQNKGEVFAFDINQKRLGLVKQQASRLGINIIKTISTDASSEENVKRYGESFDRVLVDAPCSGLGTLRRNPDAKWRRRERDILELSEIQFKVLSQSGRMVKPGGVIVYAVCTLMPEENEKLCQRFLSSNPKFRVDMNVESPPYIKSTFLDRNGYFVSDPARLNMDGFFAARFRKVG